ncbi:hypothetical protein LP421_13390 [Rhizobium sp. RCAM05350]|nr:hypothetical protein LP421_13390 [Rhizobium sp. RCAM05350]
MTSGASIEQHFPFHKAQIGKISKPAENNGISRAARPGWTGESAGHSTRKASALGPFGNACKFMRWAAHISHSTDFLSIGLALEAGLKSLGQQHLAPPGRPMFQNESQRDLTR